MTVRTRFAPSPTGYLHIGGARTALYSWLFARHHQGQFILRIEDTDVERSTQESVDAILQGMAWLELEYDEGPYYQSKRIERYHEVANQLVHEGKAYHCYCTKERLEALRAEQMAKKQKPRYDGHCRDVGIKKDLPYVIRFRNPHEGIIEFEDQVFGHMVFQVNELDDLIMIRSDGMPTYNFSVVVDDYDMKITHVIRGDDHLNNTPRQINILQALGAPLPIYAHLPMILGQDGKRFSKRHGAVSVMQYHNDGYLADALINYLVRLGWSHGDQEIFTRAEMIELFDLKGVHKSPAAFNPEKLLWLNQHYIKAGAIDKTVKALAWQMHEMGLPYQQGIPLLDIVNIQAERAKTVHEMADKSRFFYHYPSDFTAEARKHLNASTLPILNQVAMTLTNLNDWQTESIHHAITQIAEQSNLKLGKVAQPIRAAVTGDTVSPPIDATLVVLGKDETLRRIDYAVKWIEKL